MYKTRYKYKVTFSSPSGNGSNTAEYTDMYAITFNRTNGSTPSQQERIYKQTKACSWISYKLNYSMIMI